MNERVRRLREWTEALRSGAGAGRPVDHVVTGLSALGAELAQAAAELEAARDAAGARAEHYRQLFDEAPVAVVVLTRALAIAELNRRARALLGVRAEPAEEPFEPFEPFVASADRHAWEALVRAPGHTALSCELALRTASGAERRCRVTALGRPNGDRLVVIDDVADEREEMARALFETQKLEAVGQLSAGVAHDMNNVLAAILACASNHDQSSPRELGEAMREIRAAALRGRELTDRLSSLFRKSPIRARTFDLVDLVRQVAGLLRRTLPSSIAVEASLPDDRWWLDGDDEAWHQALLNLAINARDAMPDGGVLRLECGSGPTGRELRVSDNGLGMSADVLARAFEPFFTTKPFGQGTGLGLSHVRAVAQSHQVDVRCESTPGAGTRFRFLFPHALVRAAPHGESGAVEAEARVGETRPRPRLPPTQVSRRAITARQVRGRILLVDDDETVRHTTARLLKRVGIQVVEAPSARDALALIESAGPFDVVVSDLAMPLMDGEALAATVLTRTPEQPFVMVTGGLRDDRLQRLQALGVKEVVTKPFTVPEILAVLTPLFPKRAPSDP